LQRSRRTESPPSGGDPAVAGEFDHRRGVRRWRAPPGAGRRCLTRRAVSPREFVGDAGTRALPAASRARFADVGAVADLVLALRTDPRRLDPVRREHPCVIRCDEGATVLAFRHTSGSFEYYPLMVDDLVVAHTTRRTGFSPALRTDLSDLADASRRHRHRSRAVRLLPETAQNRQLEPIESWLW